MMLVFWSLLSFWTGFALFCVLTGQSAHLDLVERICTALEWLSGWLNRLACFGRAGSDAYRMMLKRDTPAEDNSKYEEMPEHLKGKWEKYQMEKGQ